jgi:Lipase (class 3)
VTGHSLGGALATLAAHDIATAVKCLPKMALSVYTFGAPRVGNHGVFTVVPAYNFVAECRSWHEAPLLEPKLCVCLCYHVLLYHSVNVYATSKPFPEGKVIGRIHDFHTVDLQPSHVRSASVCRSCGMSSMTR